MSDDLIRLKFGEYLTKYSKKYSSNESDYIKENFFEEAKCPDPVDILMQLYSDLKVFDEESDRYYGYLSILEKNFDIGKNILEIGGGYIPAFANILAKKQLEIKRGKITVIDPVLVLDKAKYGNMKLIKENFTSDTIIEPYDLLVGIMPCDATELILRQACKNKKDFFIALCGCSHLSFYESMVLGMSNYQKYIIECARKLLEENDNGELCIEEFPKKYKMDYPIIYNKKS